MYSAKRIRQAETDFLPVGQFVAVEGIRLHYISSGLGKPVALIHGIDSALQDFTMSIFDQVAADYQAIAFDRPGNGHSERPANEPLTLALNARLIHDALRELGIEKPVLVGISYGGAVALKYALEYPNDVAGLVLLAPAAYAEEPLMSLVSPVFYLPDMPLLGPFLVHGLLVPVRQVIGPWLNRRAFSPDPLPLNHDKTMEAFSQRPRQFKTVADEWKAFGPGLHEMSPRYGEIRVPVFVVVGDSDLVTKPENHADPLHNAIPHSQLVVLKDTGHELHYKHPETVMKAIRSVLEPKTIS